MSKHLDSLYQITMRLLIENITDKNFLTQKEYEDNFGVICIVKDNFNKIKEDENNRGHQD